MTGKEVAKRALLSTKTMMPLYLADLADEDLWIQPVPGANTIGWQMHHLIESEQKLIKQQLPQAEYAGITSPGERATKAEYLSQFNKVRDATVANLEMLSDSDLNRPNTGPLAHFAPTVADLMLMISYNLMGNGR